MLTSDKFNNISVFDSRAFYINSNHSLLQLYNPSSLLELDKSIESISETLVSVLKTINNYPVVKYLERVENGKSIAARLAWKLDSRIKQEFVNSHNDTSQLEIIILDRSFDCQTPLARSFHFQAAIHDLLEIQNSHSVQIQNHIVDLSERDDIFVHLRHQYLGDVGDFIQRVKENEIIKSDIQPLRKNESNSKKTATPLIQNFNQKQRIMDYDALFNSICSIIEEGHLENVGDLEQCLLTNEKYDSKTLNISFLQDLEATFHHFAFNDVLRLLLLGLLRFPNSHLPKLFQDFAGEVGVDALVGLRHLTRNIDISPNSTWKYDHVSWKHFSQPVRKKYELTSKQEYLSRYEPSIKNILTDYIINNSSSVKSIDDILNHTTSHTSNSSIKPLRHFKPSWATLDPSSAIIDSSKEKKVIIFVLGGISVSEIQAIHESAKELDRSILIGSTELLTPTTFLNELCLLGVSRPQPLPLPTIQSCIEKEQDQLYRQQLLESQKRLQEEFAANKELEKLALVRRNTILQRINDRPPKHAPPNGYGKILGKLDRTDLKRNLSTFSRKRTVLDDTKSEVLDHKKSVPRIPKKSEVPRLPLFDDDTFSTLSESIENVLHVEVSRWGQNQLYSTCSLDRSKVGQPDSMIKPITDTVDKSVSQMDVIHSTEETKETVEKSELTRQPHTYRIKRRSKVKLAAVEAFKSQLSNHPASGVIPDRVSSCWANKIGSCFQFKKTD